MHRVYALIVLQFICVSALSVSRSHAADEKAKPAFELKDGDRVAFIGNTFIEREQQSGYIELALTLQYPDRNITFRNLGWSGDNVYGESRARFGSVQDGFKHLIDNAKAVKPTVLIVSYGHNAAFAGEAGVEKFIKGYERLLDTLQKDVLPKDGRIVLITPHKQENMGPPLPDPSAYNQYLVQYRDAIFDLGKKRGHAVLNLSNMEGCKKCIYEEKVINGERSKHPEYHTFKLTNNGMHFTPFGYWHVSTRILQLAHLHPNPWRVRFAGKKVDTDESHGMDLAEINVAADRISFQASDWKLPLPMMTVKMPPDRKVLWTNNDQVWAGGMAVTIDGLKPGRYEIRIDGKTVVTTTAKELKHQTPLLKAPQFAQVEKLRQTIVEKNELFFHRWRPANETYIYLFRKHEQGNNAKEMPMFDPLIEAKEKEIAKLKKPGTHKYEIVRVGD